MVQFLSYRKIQVCDVEGVASEPHNITCGAPQGSILLFFIYINASGCEMQALAVC